MFGLSTIQTYIGGALFALLLAVGGFAYISQKDLATARAESAQHVVERDAWKGQADALVKSQGIQQAAVTRLEQSQTDLASRLSSLAISFNSARLRTQANENPSQLDAALNDRYADLVRLRDGASVVAPAGHVTASSPSS